MLKVDQVASALRRVGRGRVRRRARGLVVLVLGVLALSLAGCGKQVPPYWPDIAVDGDVIYVAEASGQVFALRAEDGDVMWAYPIAAKKRGGLLGWFSRSAPTDGPFYAAPAFGEEFVFLGSAGEQQRSLWGKGENNAGLRALNTLGVLQWEYKVPADRTVASPALTESTAYLASSDHSVYAIDLQTREARWVFETGNWVWATPLVVDDMVYIASMDHVLYAVDDASGAEVWRFSIPSSALPAQPVYSGGVLYLGSLSGHVYAVDARAGAVVWETKVDGGMWASPAVHEEAEQGASVVYLGTLNGRLYAISAADGSPIWDESLEGEVRGTPAYVDGTIYVGGEDGRLYAFDARDGRQVGSPLGMKLEKASIYTSPAYDGQHLYVVATDGQVFALDLERKAVVWQTNPLEQEEREEE